MMHLAHGTFYDFFSFVLDQSIFVIEEIMNAFDAYISW